MNWTAFLNGAARVLDLFGTMSEPVDLAATDDEALQRDLQAIAGDWQSVAHDMNDAIGGIKRRKTSVARFASAETMAQNTRDQQRRGDDDD